MSSRLRKATFSALRWNYVGLIVRSGSNFLIGVFLARLLGPKPFGQLAAATFVVGIATLISDAGFTSALIQAPTLSRIQIRYVFTMQFLIAISMTLACAAASGLVAEAFRDPAVRGVLLSISPLFMLQAFGQTSSALLRRDLQFRSLQTLQIISYFIGYLGVGIPLAFLGAGVFSLVAAQLVQAAGQAVMLYVKVRHPLLLTFDRSGRSLVRFGAKVTISNTVFYGVSNADNFVVGHAFGSTALGFYSRAFTLAAAPSDGVVGALMQVLFAACSRAEGRIEPIRRAYLACLAAVAFVVFPAFWAMSACAVTVMTGLYGERWMPAALLFQPLVIAMSLHSLMNLASPILSSLNQVQREIWAQTASLVLALTIFFIASQYSPLVLAWGVCGAYLFRFLLLTHAVMRVLVLRWKDILRVLAGPAMVGVLVTVAVHGADVLSHRLHIRPSFALPTLIAAGLMAVAGLVVPAGRYLLPAEIAVIITKSTASMPRLQSVLFGTKHN